MKMEQTSVDLEKEGAKYTVAISILRATNDGDFLLPKHLYLLECFVNGFKLTKEGQKNILRLAEIFGGICRVKRSRSHTVRLSLVLL